MFANPDYMNLFLDWEYHAKGLIARFRATVGKSIGSGWFVEFINKLKQENKDFESWWTQHDVHSMTEVIKEIQHPILNKLVFELNSFDVSSDPNLKLIIHTPLKSTDTVERLKKIMIGLENI